MEKQWKDGWKYYTTVNRKYTHNFFMGTRLDIYTVDLKKPTETVEKHISNYTG